MFLRLEFHPNENEKRKTKAKRSTWTLILDWIGLGMTSNGSIFFGSLTSSLLFSNLKFVKSNKACNSSEHHALHRCAFKDVASEFNNVLTGVAKCYSGGHSTVSWLYCRRVRYCTDKTHSHSAFRHWPCWDLFIVERLTISHPYRHKTRGLYSE